MRDLKDILRDVRDTPDPRVTDQRERPQKRVQRAKTEARIRTSLNDRRSLLGLYKRLRNEIKRKGKVAWKLTQLEWVELWMAAGQVRRGDGSLVPAWTMRGKSRDKSVWVKRWDELGDYELANLHILYRGAVLADGRRVAELLKDLAV